MQFFFHLKPEPKKQCGDKQELRGVLPPLCNVPNATELVSEPHPYCQSYQWRQTPVSIVTIEYVPCYVRSEAEERVFIFFTECVLCQVRGQDEATVEHWSYYTAQHNWKEAIW